jgi:glycogen debranching enzyme
VRVVQAVQSHRTLSALSSIAAALAPTDPDRAARLFTDAERIANSITDAFWKAGALIDVAKAVAPTDPDRAERIANSITGGFLWGAATVECGRSRNSALAMIT